MTSWVKMMRDWKGIFLFVTPEQCNIHLLYEKIMQSNAERMCKLIKHDTLITEGRFSNVFVLFTPIL